MISEIWNFYTFIIKKNLIVSMQKNNCHCQAPTVSVYPTVTSVEVVAGFIWERGSV